MLNKRIANIVFYKVPEGTKEVKQATIFYTDGTVANVSFDQGIDACEQIVKERNIRTKDAFKEMINREIVHVVSAKEFRDNFYRYVPANVAEKVDETMNAAGVVTPVAEVAPVEETVAPVRAAAEDVEEDEEEKDAVEDAVEDEKEEVEEADNSANVTPIAAAPVVAPVGAAAAPNPSNKEEVVSSEETVDPDKENYSDSDSAELEDAEVVASTNTKTSEKEEKPGFFKRMWNKIKENKFIKRLILCTTALAIGLGIYSCSQRKSPEGEMYNSNIPSISDTNFDNNDNQTINIGDNVTLTETDEIVVAPVATQGFFSDPAIVSLLNATQNQTQHGAMYNVGLALDAFNGDFASHYLEEGVDVRAALRFEEVVALQTAYNDYSKEELRAIFNGADFRAEDLTRAYKDGSLQLMGAYAIETPEHPVDMSMLIDSQEGKDFYRRYHQAFLAAKTATGDEKIRLVTEFYNMVRADFPITNEVRTEGISHAENYDQLEAYKLSVAPMIAAAEMMWQNLEIDVTLDDAQVDFINDLGLCNFAQKTFERAELISLTSQTDNTNPTYEQYRQAFINYYTAQGIYYIDDEHRELTKLQAFQDAVNWHAHIPGIGGAPTWEGESWTETETHEEVETWTETETTAEWEEVTETPVDESEVPEDIREDLQEQVDAQIEEENQEAQAQAEAEAQEVQQQMQAEEDQHAAEVEQEVMQDEQNLQEEIDNINEQIGENQDGNPDNDQPINENDHPDIDFDDQYTDDQGNLDPCVENITTDPTGDMTDQPLPDPEDTGREFDEQANDGAVAQVETAAATVESYDEVTTDEGYSEPPVFTESEEPVVESYSEDQWVETVQVSDDYYYEGAWVEEDPVDYSGAVDAYVESLDGVEAVEEEAFEYAR